MCRCLDMWSTVTSSSLGHWLVSLSDSTTSTKKGKKVILHNLSIYKYYKTKSSAASVCLFVCLLTKTSKTTQQIFMRFSPIDRVILPENTGI